MDRKTIAYVAPFVTFELLLAVSDLLEKAHDLPGGVSPKHLIFPLQTVVCALLVAWYWREYRLRAPRKLWLTLAIAAFVFVLWVCPQLLFHQPPRRDGFDIGVFAGQPLLYWTEIILRFLRLIVVVPALEEVFWRGFLLRYFIHADFDSVPFGAYSRMSNAFVALGFMLEHSWHDYPAALVAGVLYNFVAYRSRSLSSCIIAHAVTNALLGASIVTTHQWGFW
jgi:CAAX prenyl protease-like protein